MARRSSRLGIGFLIGAGAVLCLAGGAAIWIGVVNPQLISDQLPPEAEIDALAVGGAAVALGVATLLLGVVHVGVGLALRRGVGMAETAGVVLSGIMAMLSFGFAVSALVSIASAAAPAVLLLPAAIGLAAATTGYAATATGIIGARRRAL